MPALAGPFEDSVAKFANDEFSDTEAAVGEIAASGNALASPIISALQDGRLSADPDSKKVFITQADGKIVDATTGAAVDKLPDNAAAVRLNNRLRRTVEAALGGLTLLSPDPAKRLAAAQSVFKSHEENLLPTVESALAKESVKPIKQAFAEARAAIVLFKSDASDSDKLDAVAVVKARGDQEALALLTGLGDQPPPVAKAAAGAVSSIQSNLAMWSMVQNAWYGLSLGSVLLLAAIGLAITFGVMGVINMAHGEMVMLGAYTTFVVQEVIRTRYPALFDYSLLIAVPLAFLVAGFIGVLIIVHPGGDLFTPAILLPFCSALFFCFYQLLTRKLAEIDSPTTSNFFAGLCNTLVMSALVPFFWQVPSLGHALLMLALGSCGMTAHLFLTQAFRHAAPALLAPFGYCQIVFAGLLGWLLFNHTPSLLTTIGIAVICCSGLAAAWQQSRKHKPL